MNRLVTLLAIVVIAGVVAFGCSKNKSIPSAPLIDPSMASETDQGTGGSVTSLLGYYDIYFDIGAGTFEAVENRTAEFTLNIVPFLNQMTNPHNGITFGSIVIHDEDPEVFGVDVEFRIHHPFPGVDQYKVYDLRGVIIGNGSKTFSYKGLDVPSHGTDLWMKNADGYTRWFNPVDFTTELIFGYAPGGYQNLKGNSQLNPYKYYADGLGKNGNVWNFLNGSNNDGLFKSGTGRTMQLEFPMPPDGIGIAFGYAVVVGWEEPYGPPPIYPAHINEAAAAFVEVTPDIWYDPIAKESGGDLILDVDLYNWKYSPLPSKILIESSVLNGLTEFDAESYGQVVSENVSRYHLEVPSKDLNSLAGHYFWVITEYDGYNYMNYLPGIPHASGPLAAFFRYDLDIGSYLFEVESPNGGEVLLTGNNYQIQWSTSISGGTVKIEYSKDGFSSDIHTIAVGQPNNGSYMWNNVPNDPSITVRVRITYEPDPTIRDISDNDFAICSSASLGNVTGFSASDGGTMFDQNEVQLTWNEVSGCVQYYEIQRRDFTWGTDWEPGSWQWKVIQQVPAPASSWNDTDARHSGPSAPISYMIKACNSQTSSPSYATDTGYPRVRDMKVVLWCVADNASGSNACASWADGSSDYQANNIFWNGYGVNFVLQNPGGFKWIPEPKYRILSGDEAVEMHEAYGKINNPDCLNVYYVDIPQEGKPWVGMCWMYCSPDYHTTENVFVVMKGYTGTPSNYSFILPHEMGHALRFDDQYTKDFNGNCIIDPGEDCSIGEYCLGYDGGWPLICDMNACYPEEPGYPTPPGNLMWYDLGSGYDVYDYNLYQTQYIYMDEWLGNHEENYPWP